MMHRAVKFGVAAAALAAAPVSLHAADAADAERAFAVAARSFTNCLLEAAHPADYGAADRATPRTDLANVCLVQEAAFRQHGVRLRLSRGQAEQQAVSETDAAIIAGRRGIVTNQSQRYASAR